MTSKEIYESIDQSKLSSKGREFLKSVEKNTKGFTKQNDKVDSVLKKLYADLKIKKPEALKDVTVKTVEKEVKVPTTKSERKKEPKKKTKVVKEKVKKATGKKKNTKPTKTPSTPKKGKEEHISTRASKLAKKDGITFKEARAKLSKIAKEQLKKDEKETEKELDKLLKFVRKGVFEDGEKYPKTHGKQDPKGSSVSADAKRKAKPVGRRVSEKSGETTNQYGTFKNKTGRVYYESRDNRSDRNSVKAPKGQYKYKGQAPPFLADGGAIDSLKKDMNSKLDIHSEYYAKGGRLKVYDESYDVPIKTFNSFEKAKNWVLANHKKYDEITIEDAYLDTIVVDKTDTKDDIEFLFSDNMAKGGMIEIDEDGSNIPSKLQEVFDQFNEDEDSYKEMERLRLKAQEVGYDFDYDLSGEPTEFMKINKMAKGGNVTAREKLEKELHKLQRDLNSSRLNTFIEGDNSDEEKQRQRERASKLRRFNEVLEVLNEIDAKGNKMAKGGRTISIVNDGVKFDKSKYKAVYGDFDNDGTVNIDDANPLDKTKSGQVEGVELRKTFDKLLGVKAELDEIMYDAVETLDEKAPKGADIYARTKTPYSILKKLVEKRMLDPKRGLTDMIGTTIAVDNQKELEKVRDDIDGGLLGKVLDRDDFYKTPNAGYMAYHYIVEYKGVPVEVQLKTKNMKKLHEVSHEAYKNGTLNAKSLDSLSKTFMRADKGDAKAKSEISKLLSDKKLLASKISKGSMAKGGVVSDKRQRVAELLVQMDYDNGFYDEELDREYGTTTVDEAIQWELENRVKTDKDADEYIEQYDFEQYDYAKGGKTDGDTLGDFKKRLLDLGDKEFVEYKEKQLKKQDLYYAFKDRLKDVHKQTIVRKDDLPFEKGGEIDAFIMKFVKDAPASNLRVDSEQLTAKLKRGGKLANKMAKGGDVYDLRPSKEMIEKEIKQLQMHRPNALTDLERFRIDKKIRQNKEILKHRKSKMEAGGTLPTPFGQAGLVGETGTMNEIDLFAMGGGLPQGVHQYYGQTYNPAYPTPHGYAKGGRLDVKRIKSKKFKTKKEAEKRMNYLKTNPFYDKNGKKIILRGIRIEKEQDGYMVNASFLKRDYKFAKGGSVGGRYLISLDGRNDLWRGNDYDEAYDEFINQRSKYLYKMDVILIDTLNDETLDYYDAQEDREQDDDFAKGGTLPTPFGQAGLVGETGAMNEMDLFAMGGGLPQGVHQYYAQTYNPAYPTPHGYEKGGKLYYQQDGIGQSKYTVSFYDGKKTHKDGSPFYDIAIFKNKKDLKSYIEKLESEGYKKKFAKGGMTDVERQSMIDMGYTQEQIKESEDNPRRGGRFAKGGEIVVKGIDKNGGEFYREFDSYENALEEISQPHFNHLDRDSIRYYDENDDMIFAKGGKIGFDGLAKKVAKKYEGKPVKEKFQSEYGKTYSKAEAMEVGKKVAGKVYRQQQSMAKGGEIKMSEVYNVNGKDYLFSTPIQNAKGTYTGWDAYEVVYDTFDGEKHLNYTKTKKGKSKYFPNGVKRTEAEDYFAKGGKTQGYNDKLDESLGNTKGKRSTKEQNYKDRRNESEAMKKKGGKRKYSSVKTMDKGSRSKRKTPLTLAKEIRKEGEKWQDAVKRASAILKKEAK